MTAVSRPAITELIDELSELLGPVWPEYRIRARASGLVAEGEGGNGGGNGGEGG